MESNIIHLSCQMKSRQEILFKVCGLCISLFSRSVMNTWQMLNDFQLFQKSSGSKGSMAHVACPLCITPLSRTLDWTQVSGGAMQVGPWTCPFCSTMNYIQGISSKQVWWHVTCGPTLAQACRLDKLVVGYSRSSLSYTKGGM